MCFQHRKTAQFFIFILMFIVLFVYAILPERTFISLELYKYTILIHFIATFVFFKAKNKVNYFDFDFVFISVYTICSFFSTAFSDNQIVYWSLFLGMQFDVQYVNIGNLMSLIGILSYYIGSLSVENKKTSHLFRSGKLLKTKFLGVMLILSIVAFILLGGLNYYKSVYLDIASNHSAFVTHVLLLINVMSIVFTTSEMYNLKLNANYKVRKIPFVFILLFSLLLLECGNRTAASFLVLPFLGLYTMIFKKIKILYMSIGLLMAIVFMWVVGEVRIGAEVNNISTYETYATMFKDLTLPSRNNYSVYEYVKEFGYTYGKSMFYTIIAVIPFMSSFLNVEDSGTILTKYYYSKVVDPNEVGLGTTINADLYLAFGIVGVVAFMYILGKVVSKSYISASLNNYYGLLSVALLMAFSVYIVRATFFFPCRYWVYSFVIAFCIKEDINKSFVRLKNSLLLLISQCFKM